MNGTLDLLTRLVHRGARLHVDGDDLSVRGGAGVLSADLVEALREDRSNIVDVLRDGRRIAAAVWADAVQDIADRWQAVQDQHGTAPWLDPERDEELQRAVGSAIRAGDLQSALVTTAEWRDAWTELLAKGEPTPRQDSSPEALVIADELIAEADGIRPPPNASVQMFREFRWRAPR